jgi:hypothetical protein
MSKLLKVLTIGIIATAVLAIAVFFITQSQRSFKTIYNAIPESALAVFEARSTGPAWAKLTTDKGFWPALLAFDQFKNIDAQIKLLDSIARQIVILHKSLNHKPMALSLHKTEDGFGFLLVIETGSDLRFSQAESLAKEQLDSNMVYVAGRKNNHPIGQVVDSLRGRQFNFSVGSGLFICSFDQQLLEQSLDQISLEQNLLSDQSFARMRETTGRAVDGHLFVHGTRITTLMENAAALPYKSSVGEMFSNFSGWAGLDLLLKPGEILLNGYTDIDAENSYLAAIKNQNPVPPRLFNVIPFTAQFLLHFGMDDYTQFNQTTVNQEKIDDLNRKFNLNFRQNLIQQVNGELALSFGSGRPIDRAFVVARLNNQKTVAQLFRQLGAKTSGNQAQQPVDNVTIAHINTRHLAATIFGEAFSTVEHCWYAIFDNYLIIANNAQTIEEVVRRYRSGRTLDLNDNFKAFANNLSYQSNILLYTSLRESSEIIKQYIDPALLKPILSNIKVINNFEGLAIQFSQISGLIYTNVYLKYNPEFREEGMISWRTKLDAPVAGKPFIIEDHTTGKYNVVVFDSENNMYLVSPDGEIYWKRQINEAPVSNVFAIDFYKNGRIQYLFNTANYMHLIDRNGDNVANYPIRLRSQATNGISVFDYTNNRDYRILVNGADKTTYNYDIRGREVQGWQKPRSQEIVTKAVERLVADGRDYIIITDIDGNIRIVDRQGRTRINPRGNIDKALHSDFYVNRTNSRGILLTTNRRGQLLYVAANGTLSTTDFGNYSPQHFFLYEDFNQNNSIDFIYLDGNKLIIFDRFRNTLYEQQFSNNIISKPVFFNVTRTNRLLGIVSEKSREIFLIDKEGRLITSSGLVGETPFAVGSLHNDSQINLITGLGDMVYNYVIY